MTEVDGVRLLIAGDGAWRAALVAPQFDVVGHAGSADQAASVIARCRPEVAIISADLPGGGFQAACRVAALPIRARVVLVTPWLDEGEMLAAARAGIHGYLSASMSARALAKAVAQTANGEAAITRRHAALLISELTHLDRRLAARPPRLTRVEAEILRLRSSGQTILAIATRLAVPELDVQRHLSSALRKLEARDELQQSALS